MINVKDHGSLVRKRVNKYDLFWRVISREFHLSKQNMAMQFRSAKLHLNKPQNEQCPVGRQDQSEDVGTSYQAQWWRADVFSLISSHRTWTKLPSLIGPWIASCTKVYQSQILGHLMLGQTEVMQLTKTANIAGNLQLKKSRCCNAPIKVQTSASSNSCARSWRELFVNKRLQRGMNWSDNVKRN